MHLLWYFKQFLLHWTIAFSRNAVKFYPCTKKIVTESYDRISSQNQIVTEIRHNFPSQFPLQFVMDSVTLFKEVIPVPPSA